jgi:ABC-type multidrug transport system fused ATPase/permease subunit
MEDKDFQKYFETRYQGQKKWYASKARLNKKKYFLLQWTVIVLAAVTPILVVSFTSSNTRWITVLISAFVAVGTAALKTFQYQEKWINYRTTAEMLKKEEYFYMASVGDYQKSQNRKRLFVERVESIISNENTSWFTLVKEKPPEKDNE